MLAAKELHAKVGPAQALRACISQESKRLVRLCISYGVAEDVGRRILAEAPDGERGIEVGALDTPLAPPYRIQQRTTAWKDWGLPCHVCTPEELTLKARKG